MFAQVKTMSSHHRAAGTSEWKSQSHALRPVAGDFEAQGLSGVRTARPDDPILVPSAAGIPRASQAQFA